MPAKEQVTYKGGPTLENTVRITEDEIKEIANLLTGLRLTKPSAFMFNDIRTINSFYIKATGRDLFSEDNISNLERALEYKHI